MFNNLILDTDSYKASHWLQYPPHTVSMFSYLESRGGEFQETVFFGLQYILKEYFTKPVTMEMVEEADVFFKAHGLPFNRAGWERVVNVHKGMLPVRIRAVPEGSVIKTHNVLMTVESTDPECFWVVSWLETQLMRLWYPITVATLSREAKKVIYKSLQETADDPDAEIAFKLHDFGSRGVSSAESAAIGGAAHLVNFQGSDTVNGILLANKYYGCDMAGFSIPAAEHSSITSWGREREVDAYRNMVNQFMKPGAIVAVVSDSYDIYKATTDLWGKQLKEEVVKSGATLVVRPDSGNPINVVHDVVDRLATTFGFTYNSKGYKVLKNVRVIQGDGVDLVTIKAILRTLNGYNYSTTNIAFGMGGALLQKVNRDTQKFAFKCSSITMAKTVVWDGVEQERIIDRDVCKDPIDDAGKKSKAGRLDLTKDGTVRVPDFENVHPESILVDVFRDGKILVETTLEEVRGRAKVV